MTAMYSIVCRHLLYRQTTLRARLTMEAYRSHVSKTHSGPGFVLPKTRRGARRRRSGQCLTVVLMQPQRGGILGRSLRAVSRNLRGRRRSPARCDLLSICLILQKALSCASSWSRPMRGLSSSTVCSRPKWFLGTHLMCPFQRTQRARISSTRDVARSGGRHVAAKPHEMLSLFRYSGACKRRGRFLVLSI
jgi:hypothetical protein